MAGMAMKLLGLWFVMGCSHWSGFGRETRSAAPARLLQAPLTLIVPLPANALGWASFDETKKFWPLESVPEAHPGAELTQLIMNTDGSPSQLCQERTQIGQLPQQWRSYASGWCAIWSKDNTGLALIAAAQTGSDRSLAAAATADLAFLLSSLGPASTNLEWIVKNSVETPALLDALSAYYATRHRFGDARSTLERAIAIDPASIQQRCERTLNLARILEHTGVHEDGLPLALKILSIPGAPRDCQIRASAVVCEMGLSGAARAHRMLTRIDVTQVFCRNYLHYRPDLERVLLAAAVIGWPQEGLGPDVWLSGAELASWALSYREAVDLTLIALENFTRAGNCQFMESDLARGVLDRLERAKLSVAQRTRVSPLRHVSRHDVNANECRHLFGKQVPVRSDAQ